MPPRCLVVRSGLPAADVAAADLVQQCSTVSACVLAALHGVACNFLRQLCAHTASALSALLNSTMS